MLAAIEQVSLVRQLNCSHMGRHQVTAPMTHGQVPGTAYSGRQSMGLWSACCILLLDLPSILSVP